MGFLKGVGLFLLVWLGSCAIAAATNQSIIGGIGLIVAIVVVFIVGFSGGFKGKEKEA